MDELRRFEFLRKAPPTTTQPASVPVGVGAMRQRIDTVDDELLQLVDERARLALAIQEQKGSEGHGQDVARERDLLAKARASADSTLDADELESVLAAVLKASRQMQRRHAAKQVVSANANGH